MNEVSEENFKSLYPELKRAINNASFITIDAEFTGINSEEGFKHSLFDTLDDRYSALKRNIQQFIIVQFGIGVFNHVLSENTYTVDCYNFYLLPRPVPFKNRQFSWQVTALEFLYKHNFQFDRFINEGISYLDEVDEKLLRDHLAQGNLTHNLEHLTYEEEDMFKDCKTKVFKWLTNKQNQTPFQLEATSPILKYMLQKEIRSSFKNVWTTAGYKNVGVIEVSNDMRALLEKEDNNRLEQALLDSYIGFSNVFKLLSSSKKPIIGHNILLDLMFMHQQFYKPLPDSYRVFKSNIHTIFPQIYDTKFLSFELRKLFDKDEVTWKLNSLSTLYKYFTSTGKQLVCNSPKIKLNKENYGEKSYHNAGWDAYFAGYIFVKMGHVLCVKKFGTGLEERAMTHSELMSSVRKYVNSVNISRGNEVYMKFDGADPALSRPEWLHVKLNAPNMDTKQLIEKFSSFGQVDVMPFARRRVLVAVASHNSALHILQHFKNSKELQVARYSRVRHAAPSTICLWSGLALSGSMFAWMINKMILKSS